MNELQIKGNWNVIKGKQASLLANSPTMILPIAKATKTNWSGASSRSLARREKRSNAPSARLTCSWQLYLR
jgi:hypothetical protein